MRQRIGVFLSLGSVMEPGVWSSKLDDSGYVSLLVRKYNFEPPPPLMLVDCNNQQSLPIKWVTLELQTWCNQP